MKKSIVQKFLFVCLLVLSATCFSYLSLYGSETVFMANTLGDTSDIQSGTMSDVHGMKNIIVKILKMMMLKF